MGSSCVAVLGVLNLLGGVKAEKIENYCSSCEVEGLRGLGEISAQGILAEPSQGEDPGS
jgi:hypothetical protein